MAVRIDFSRFKARNSPLTLLLEGVSAVPNSPQCYLLLLKKSFGMLGRSGVCSLERKSNAILSSEASTVDNGGLCSKTFLWRLGDLTKCPKKTTATSSSGGGICGVCFILLFATILQSAWIVWREKGWLPPLHHPKRE
ncbi:hypothetical protein CEXT_249281 [Caerostris extrusa]|uniref:Uncharacterized protein n=1 Tax=Caerostris extrusa TaxID=172846 RepID=A0AAV4SEQ5_CAEEX|nr:hypothetical protein CEXT_249281 [Caerostris extrusa]